MSSILSPAKINLHLRIGPPRADGFHPLLTWMTTIGLFDTLSFHDAMDGRIAMSCDEPSLACDDRNLVVRAAKLLRSDPTLGAQIHLQKNIPHGGGLGGGSSNAAFTLMSLNTLWDLRLNVETLDGAAAKLGSDINFFLHGPSSICRGRGELVRPIDPPSKAKWGLLILPGISMPTPAVFRRFDEMKLGSDISIEPDWRPWASLPSVEFLPRLVNDLETPSFTIEPALGELRQNIERQIARPVRMSGSGSSLFTLFDDRDESEHTAKRVSESNRCRAMAVELAPPIDIAKLPHFSVE